MSAATATGKDFVITRTVDAPRDLVWKAWTEADRLKQWFGPKGFTMPTCNLDLRPGGTFLYCLRTPEGQEMWGKWIFREIVKPERITLIQHFSDKNGGITRHPFAPDWPRETLSTMTLTESAGRTTSHTIITIQWAAYNATEVEQKTFDASHDGMNQGWSGTFEQLTAYLVHARKENAK
jgi:uncharacterized protein YndB with AHSA1/START domain